MTNWMNIRQLSLSVLVIALSGCGASTVESDGDRSVEERPATTPERPRRPPRRSLNAAAAADRPDAEVNGCRPPRRVSADDEELPGDRDPDLSRKASSVGDRSARTTPWSATG